MRNTAHEYYRIHVLRRHGLSINTRERSVYICHQQVTPVMQRALDHLRGRGYNLQTTLPYAIPT